MPVGDILSMLLDLGESHRGCGLRPFYERGLYKMEKEVKRQALSLALCWCPLDDTRVAVSRAAPVVRNLKLRVRINSFSPFSLWLLV